jgi:hypothetical protein
MNETSSKSFATSHGPRWRWEKACNIAKGDELADCADSEIANLVALRQHLNSQDASQAQRTTAFPDHFLETAYHIFAENSVPGWQLEAYVLWGLSDREIAVRCNIAREVVAAYTTVFFDVREHMRSCGWLMGHILGPAPSRGFRENEVKQFWAYVATMCDPSMLDPIIGAYLAARSPSERPVLSIYLRPGVPLPVQVTVAVTVLGISDESIAAANRLRARLNQIAAPRGSEGRKTEFERACQQILSSARAILAGKSPSKRSGLRGRNRKGRNGGAGPSICPYCSPANDQKACNPQACPFSRHK